MNIEESRQLFRRYEEQCDSLDIAEFARLDIHEFLARCVEQPDFLADILIGLPELRS